MYLIVNRNPSYLKDELPLLACPDEYQYVVALQVPPTLLNEASLSGQQLDEPPVAPLSGPACDLSSFNAMEPIIWEGQLVDVDDSAAAGVARELKK
jgi:hypothetical protein